MFSVNRRQLKFNFTKYKYINCLFLTVVSSDHYLHHISIRIIFFISLSFGGCSLLQSSGESRSGQPKIVPLVMSRDIVYFLFLSILLS